VNLTQPCSKTILNGLLIADMHRLPELEIYSDVIFEQHNTTQLLLAWPAHDINKTQLDSHSPTRFGFDLYVDLFPETVCQEMNLFVRAHANRPNREYDVRTQSIQESFDVPRQNVFAKI